MVKKELGAKEWIKERGKDPKEGRSSQYRIVME
jgi:chromosome segregation and condensation protein ScpB